MQKNELSWLVEARKYVGLKEDTSKTTHNQTLLAMLLRMGSFSGEYKSWWKEDETPWCGLFVGFCLGVGERFVVRDWYRASAWNSDKLTKLDKPAYGCIVTFTRDGGGHVGFIVGKDARGRLMVLGGNQSNKVSIVPFDVTRVSGYYWPSLKNGTKAPPLESRYELPLLESNGAPSAKELT